MGGGTRPGDLLRPADGEGRGRSDTRQCAASDLAVTTPGMVPHVPSEAPSAMVLGTPLRAPVARSWPARSIAGEAAWDADTAPDP
jgi:hypothetical protein